SLCASPGFHEVQVRQEHDAQYGRHRLRQCIQVQINNTPPSKLDEGGGCYDVKLMATCPFLPKALGEFQGLVF
ncbi:MAG: hypothetical protein JWO42_4091, partial [Chloroflexi bacterium]|nr:hypothetical protein [Chloroflexota bacterium]